MFDFDPDDAYEEDMVDDPDNDYQEDTADDIADEVEVEYDDVNDSDDAAIGLAGPVIGAAIYGMAEEAGEDEAKRKALENKCMNAKIKGERPEGAVSLKRKKKKSKLPKFEQWVKDVISGEKDLDDDM